MNDLVNRLKAAYARTHDERFRLAVEEIERLRASEAAYIISGAQCEAKLREASGLLTRANTILANMARENDGALFQRWPIHHEPLRADAKNVAPLIDAFLATMEKTDDPR